MHRLGILLGIKRLLTFNRLSQFLISFSQCKRSNPSHRMNLRIFKGAPVLAGLARTGDVASRKKYAVRPSVPHSTFILEPGIPCPNEPSGEPAASAHAGQAHGGIATRRRLDLRTQVGWISRARISRR